jgi:hypothetical protein
MEFAPLDPVGSLSLNRYPLWRLDHCLPGDAGANVRSGDGSFSDVRVGEMSPRSGLPYARLRGWGANDAILEAIQEHARQTRYCRAISMCHGGSNAEYELIELEDFSHWAWTYWNGEPAEPPTGGPVAIGIDLVTALSQLRAQHRKLRCVDDQPEVPYIEGHAWLGHPRRGKYRTLFIATPCDGEWLIRGSMILNEPSEWAWESAAAATVHGAIASRRQASDPPSADAT